jgi:hypothetical protein
VELLQQSLQRLGGREGEVHSDPGTAKGGSAGLDLGAWAAYILGHNVFTLRSWQEYFWDEHQSWQRPRARGRWDWIPREIAELEAGVQVIGEKNVVNAGVLNSFRKAADRFYEICDAMKDPITENEHVDWQNPYAPGYDIWQEMADLSGTLLSPTAGTELRAWWRFGRALGEFQLSCKNWEPVAFDEEIAAIGKAWEEVMKIRVHKFAGQVADLVGQLVAPQEPESLADQFRLARHFRLVPRLIDLHLRYGLRAEAPPEIVLTIDEESLTFWGQTHTLKDLQKIWVAVLWLLAERPGKVVSHRDIRVESGLMNKDLAGPIARLRGSDKTS